jgi:hypothetical protein
MASMLGATNGDSEPLFLPNVNYAIKVDVLRRLLPLLPQYRTALEELPGSPATLADLADRIQGSVLIVMVAE